MAGSMNTQEEHKDGMGHSIDLFASDRYEHYSAEHEADEPEDIMSSQDPDIVTPLASDTIAANESATSNGYSIEPSSIDDKNKLRNASLRHATPSSTSLSLEGYFAAHQPRSSPTPRRPLGPSIASNPSSSGSLHALSEHEGISALQSSVRRAISTKSNPGNSRIRSTSQSKIGGLSQSNSKRPSYSDQLVYPDQSLASLQAAQSNARPHPILRTRSSHPAQNLLYNDMSRMSRPSPNHGVRTADNTPMSSPGLFSPTAIRPPNLSDSHLNGPQLHHLQAPKETHTAEIEHDTYSGNKFINNYEVVGELGRGEHGKVKLGRNMERNNHCVAIKIVPRWSAKRRLGKLGAPEDITKREVAILKKARHPNVVSLLEVIDDPNKNKVYLILEFVEKGEIKWRKHGVKEVLAINNQRFDQQKLGVTLDIEPTDRDAHIVHLAHMRHERLEHMRRQTQGLSHIPNWSLEYAGETDDESEISEINRTMSRQWSHVSSPVRGNSGDDHISPGYEPPLSGSMYGSYMPEAYRNRKFSIATSAVSHMSSEMNFDLDDDQRSYVPALTLEEARGAFRDTLLGLEFLHFIGIIHRDIKPANLLVSGTGSVKISDFGVSYLGRPITEEDSENRLPESEASPLDNEKELARSVGTPAFWAPELCHTDTEIFNDKKEPKITGALDLWALGITLYCMIYARLPFYHNENMGLHEAVCTTEVFCPKTRLVPVDTTSSEHVSRPAHSINGNKRLDYELKFEHIPDSLRDLIQKLLIKDPAYRITIAEAKKHPWVTQGLSDTKEFLQNPEIAKESKKKILEISDKEVDRAVVKRNFIDKISITAGRIVGSILGRKDSRKRASTDASSAGSSSESLHSPAGSSTSTVGKADKVRESRRASLRGDELLQALKSSRDPSEHHPLAQSQSASPDSSGSPERSSSPGYFDHNIKAASTGATPGPDYDRLSRPRAPDRAVSALSTAESVKTIRASHQHRAPISDLMLTSEALHNEPSLRARVEGLWEGTTRTIHRLASRDRRHGSSRSRSNSRPPSENDGHAGPSLAVTNTYASGAIQAPNALRAVDHRTESFSSPPPSLPNQAEVPHQSPLRIPSADSMTWEQAQQINQRRQVQEILAKADNVASTQPQEDIVESCPPSPDDLIFRDHSGPPSAQISPYDMTMGAISTAISASTIASSIDAYDNSSVSQSVSNPSIGIVSGASSPPGESPMTDGNNSRFKYEPTTHTSETEPDFMRTADTVTFHGRPTTPTAIGKPLQEEHDYFGDEDDESDFSDEEGIVMGGPKRV